MGWDTWGRLCGCPSETSTNAMKCSVLAEGVGFTVLTLMSDNPGMRWDIQTTEWTIGCAPQDGGPPVVTERIEQDERVALDLQSGTQGGPTRNAFAPIAGGRLTRCGL